MIVAKIALRNLWRRKARTLILIGTVSLGLWGLVVYTAVSRGWVNGMIEKSVAMDVGHVSIQQQQFLTQKTLDNRLPAKAQELAGDIEGIEGVNSVALRLQVQGMASSARTSSGVMIYGINPEQEKKITLIADSIRKGTYLTENKRNQVVIGQKLADKLKVDVGDKIVFMTNAAGGDIASAALKITGIYNTGMPDFDGVTAFADLERVQELVSVNGITEIVIRKDESIPLAVAQQRVQEIFDGLPFVKVYTWRERLPMFASTEEMFAVFIGVIYGILFIAAALGIVNVFFMVIYERIREYGILKALGTGRVFIFNMILLESVYIGLISLGVGMLASFVTVELLQHTGINLSMFADALGEFNMPTVIYPAYAPVDLLIPVIAVMLTCVLSAILPALRAVRLNPVEAMRFV